MPLFDRVAYYISRSIPEHPRREIGHILDVNGAIEAALDSATHVISDTIEFEGANTLQKEVSCVTPYWVDRSMELGTLQDPKFFSADKELIFSGIVATSAGIPSGDKEVIIAGIKECGGQWREGLTRDVTHLFVTNTSSEKYQTAMHFRESARITILLPQWFDQCWSMQMRLPHAVFEFPDPSYMRKDHDLEAYKAQMVVNINSTEERYKRAAILSTVQPMDVSSSSPARIPAVTRNIWQGRSILLSLSLGLDARRRESVETRIRRNGGTIIAPRNEGEDEAVAVERADVLVTQHRTGPAYPRALALDKTIGTLAWLFYVERSGVVSSPRDRLLHYPVRRQPIPGFSDHVITVTNYQGEGREYLKKLIEVMGAKFTPTMTGLNTIVIAAFKSGVKTMKAEEWSVPIVTHKWLEDCFVEWRNLTPAQKKYLDYAPGVNYGTVVGDRSIGRVGLDEDPELPLVPSKQDISVPEGSKDAGKAGDEARAPMSDKKKPSVEGFPGTATSAHETRELQEVEDALDAGGDIEHVDADNRRSVDEEDADPVPFIPEKIGPPRGKKTLSGPKPIGVSAKPKIDSNTKPVTATNARRNDDSPSLSRKGKGSDKEIPIVLDSSADEAEASPYTKSQPSSRTRTVVRAISHNNSVPTPSPPKSRVMSRSKPMILIDEESSMDHRDSAVHEEEDRPIPRPQSKLKSKAGKERVLVSAVESDEDARSRVEETPPRTTRKPSSKKYRPKTKNNVKPTRVIPDPESEEDIEELPSLRKSNITDKKTGVVTFKSERRSMPSPNRVLLVELPDPRSLLESVKSRPRTPERRDSRTGPKSASPTRPKPAARTTSILAAAREAPLIESPKKRGLPRVRRDADKKSHPPCPSPLAKPDSPVAREAHNISSSSSTPPPIQRTPSRRIAAAAASQKLRDEIMPDVVSFEKERKRDTRGVGRRRKTTSSAGIDVDESSTSESDARGEKKRKVAPNRKGRTKVFERSKDDGSEPTVKLVTHVRPIKRPPSEDEGNPGPRSDFNQAKPRKKIRMSVSDDGSGDEVGLRKSSCDPKKVRIMTTKIEISEDICKALVKLGVKFTDKPAQCTHLVSHSCARTEKFLCALPNAPYVLNMGWLLESCDKKIVLAERDYFLKDPATEKKHNFKLIAALERARELKRKGERLLQGHFFYFTPNVSVDFGLMRNVIQANGAECVQKTPTARNLSSTRHIISCSQDEKLWRPLAKQGFAIYSSELVLMAALAQFVDWKDESKRVVGSH